MNPVSNPESYNSILEIIGKRLIALRLKKGYTSHVNFAEDHNLPRVQYWRMEKGKANFTFRSLKKVLEIHGLSVEELFREIAGNQTTNERPTPGRKEMS